ncbi:glycerol-3-phosphate acyltransferase [Paenibacillus physcomitrellae]|uniref:Membrane protein n=1 Tax=Paenibacillus physcomitrellae TaxID=1619311 RepID=A0ABQ1GMG5_9BACL|nr:glycerol-3-phosphate acyltransferase [Paenibacillus physcomitrellae]GGA46367.1 membrane protein [Paenibacillus physcomitrellae]
MMIAALAWVEFVFGSLMFSYWLGRLARKDVRAVGDGNPGAFNLWAAAGWKLGAAGVVLDFLKGYFPLVWLIRVENISGYGLVLLAAAPILGHLFSPFLKFRGGKGIAVTFGVWSALTAFEVALVYAILLAALLVASILLKGSRRISDEANGFQVVLGMLLLSAYLLIESFPAPILVFWLVNLILLAFANRHKLAAFSRNVLFARDRKPGWPGSVEESGAVPADSESKP